MYRLFAFIEDFHNYRIDYSFYNRFSNLFKWVSFSVSYNFPCHLHQLVQIDIGFDDQSKKINYTKEFTFQSWNFQFGRSNCLKIFGSGTTEFLVLLLYNYKNNISAILSLYTFIGYSILNRLLPSSHPRSQNANFE